MSERKTLTLKTCSRLLLAARRMAERFWIVRCCVDVNVRHGERGREDGFAGDGRTYGAVAHGSGDEFSRFGVDAYGAGAVDCVVCYDCLGEDVCEFLRKGGMLAMTLGIWFVSFSFFGPLSFKVRMGVSYHANQTCFFFLSRFLMMSDIFLAQCQAFFHSTYRATSPAPCRL